MYNCQKFYINGIWVEPTEVDWMEVINPSSEAVIGEVDLASGTPFLQ